MIRDVCGTLLKQFNFSLIRLKNNMWLKRIFQGGKSKKTYLKGRVAASSRIERAVKIALGKACI